MKRSYSFESGAQLWVPHLTVTQVTAIGFELETAFGRCRCRQGAAAKRPSSEGRYAASC
jgi:hypothetical protein